MKTGDRIKLYSLITVEGDKGGRRVLTSKIWKVVKIYEHFVLMEDKHGIRECFTYWHLRRHMKMPYKIERADGHTAWEWRN